MSVSELTLNSRTIMPAKFARNDGQPRKRVKLDAAPRNAYRYSDGEDIERRLQVQTQDGLSEGELSLTLYTQTPLTFLFFLAALTVLRNQLTIKFGEGPVQPQDERLALARSWLEIVPGAQRIFNIWEQTTEVFESRLMFLFIFMLTCSSDNYLFSPCWSLFYHPFCPSCRRNTLITS
jgi:hypothetical protein